MTYLDIFEAARAAVELDSSTAKDGISDEMAPEQYPRSYLPWTADEEDCLAILLGTERHDIDTIAGVLGRRPDAIASRLDSLGERRRVVSAAPDLKPPDTLLQRLQARLGALGPTLRGQDAPSVERSVMLAVEEELRQLGLEPLRKQTYYLEDEDCLAYSDIAGLVDDQILVAMEVDRVNRTRSLERLVEASARGISCYWLRWGPAHNMPSRKGLHIPLGIIVLECVVDYSRRKRGTKGNLAQGQKRTPSTSVPVPQATPSAPPPPVGSMKAEQLRVNQSTRTQALVSSVASKVSYDGTPFRQRDDEDLLLCSLWFEETPEATQEQLRHLCLATARRIKPLARVLFDGICCHIEGRGHDHRCVFCRSFRRLADSSCQVAVLKSECPFEEDFGDLRPETGEEFLGKQLELKIIATGETITRTVDLKSDPTSHIVSFKTPIVQSLVRAGGLRAKPGTEIVVHGNPMYVLLNIE